MKSIELVFLSGCPNVDAAREQLRRALATAELPLRWLEHDIASVDAPERVRGFASPTILVDGVDVMREDAVEGAACRLYQGSDVRGAPPLEAIVDALRGPRRAERADGSRSARRLTGLAVLPGALLAVLPVVSCPSCWPAYAGALSALGVPFLMEESWLAPLTVAALLLAVAALAFRARRRRGFGPLLLGTAAAALIVAAKFWLESSAILYAGTALLVGASVWNGWPKRDPRTRAAACASCSAQSAPDVA